MSVLLDHYDCDIDE